jgi:hypothetical protein
MSTLRGAAARMETWPLKLYKIPFTERDADGMAQANIVLT